ncbi:type II toxin-antitoxin system VapC family toxin [Methanospirillum purgamenti]|jgi:rRNA-processing protein FCF1|uniref:type II toxin-antitoxin system VapC family toxin n=1 Tax=Methanospirillum purgamenti TaxID=2834276 RepID=UPI0020281C7E|nr:MULTISPECIES: PIN domain-containing protein [Methanospirillum]MDX8549255.1 nucleotide-binding protein [Methanospirillum hungatei]
MASDRDGDADRVTVLIDTNAFLMASQFKIDLLDELKWLLGSVRIVVPDIVLSELEGLSRGKGNHAAAARLGLLFARKCEVIPSSGIGTPDDQILMSARDLQCGVVTNDRRLRDQVLDEGLPVVSLAGKQKLELIRR